MAALLRILMGSKPKQPDTEPQSLPYHEKDLKHNGTAIGPSPPSNLSAYRPSPNLVKFQNLIGIQSSRTVIPGRPAPNPGIYKRTVDEEAKAHFGYVLTTYVVNCFFLLQIVVGAALTALGAAGGPSTAVTFLGAVNTIVAGILTYLKGQGLPARLEQSVHLLRTLREHIEERERELTEPDCTLDVDEVVQSIVQMYKEVRQTAEDNAPGNVLAPKGAIATLLKKTEAGNHVPTAQGMGGMSLGDKLKEAQTTFSQAAPAMKHGLEDVKAVRIKAEQEIQAEQQKLHQIMTGAKEEKDFITRDTREYIDVESRGH
ncbi:MAG: hypothetical protein Q9218_007823 [Villophora microphyllina]